MNNDSLGGNSATGAAREHTWRWVSTSMLTAGIASLLLGCMGPTQDPGASSAEDRQLPNPSTAARSMREGRVETAPQALGEPAGSCEALTPEAIQSAIGSIVDSYDEAVRDADANGLDGAYASAARDNRAYLTEARDRMQALQAWLATVDDVTPYVTNTTAAYNIHAYARETIASLQPARHWALISAVYHVTSNADARLSFESTTAALMSIEKLEAAAGRCYMFGILGY